jgi:hypothetical protein
MAKKQKKSKKDKSSSLSSPEARALAAAVPSRVEVIEIPAGATVEVEVDVNEMAIPYTIAVDGEVFVKALVDRRKTIPPLSPGKHDLGWAFAHIVKKWKHRLTLRVNGADRVLDERSEENKDPDHSVGIVFLVVA